MNLSKRSFLTGVSAAAAALVVGPAKALGVGDWVLLASHDVQTSITPILWGDGLHDDTEAWKAVMYGLPIVTVEGNYRLKRGEDFLELDGGYFTVREMKGWNISATPLKRVLLSNLTVMPFGQVSELYWEGPI